MLRFRAEMGIALYSKAGNHPQFRHRRLGKTVPGRQTDRDDVTMAHAQLP
jgi:hypothetical protein